MQFESFHFLVGYLLSHIQRALQCGIIVNSLKTGSLDNAIREFSLA